MGIKVQSVPKLFDAWHRVTNIMMTTWNGNIFRVIGPLWGEFTGPGIPHKGQWRRALMFSLICAWIHGWVNNRGAGDLRRHRAHWRHCNIWLKWADIVVVIYSVMDAFNPILYSLWDIRILNDVIPTFMTQSVFPSKCTNVPLSSPWGVDMGCLSSNEMVLCEISVQDGSHFEINARRSFDSFSEVIIFV